MLIHHQMLVVLFIVLVLTIDYLIKLIKYFYNFSQTTNYIYWFTAKWWSSKSQRSKRKTQPRSPNFTMEVISASDTCLSLNRVYDTAMAHVFLVKCLSNLYIVGSKIINKIDKVYPATAWSPSDSNYNHSQPEPGLPGGPCMKTAVITVYNRATINPQIRVCLLWVV